MRNTLFKLSQLSALGALLLTAGCQTTTSIPTPAQDETPPPSNPGFAGEMNKFNAQFPNDQASRYEEVSLDFNNARKLDQQGNCHDLSKWPVTVILVLDADGKVSSSTADVSSKKAQCFQNLYASAQFPSPPFAPYRKPIKLR